MELLTDVAFLSRLQFALVVIVHFCFVPLSIGLGLIVAITETRYYKTRDPKDAAATRFWVKVFTTTFAIGVATGITMEFSFGTNWANYSRFVGDIFGAPLAAEALFAFFLESSFLGVLVLGRKKVSPKFYMVSAWLVWAGSCLSALWILIANSWMQTPGGSSVDAATGKAVLENFFGAALNFSTGVRYFHTVIAMITLGAFIAMAVSAFYMRKESYGHFATKTLKIGAFVSIVGVAGILLSAHMTAVEVANQQPSKFAMMEGHYEAGPVPLYLVGNVDTENQEVVGIGFDGLTSWLASWSTETSYPGLNDIAAENGGMIGDRTVEEMPTNIVFHSYHIMVALFGVIAVILALALIAVFQKSGSLRTKKWWQWIMFVSPLAPFFAIQAGWMTAEIGRQPWIVYPATGSQIDSPGVELLVNDAISEAVTGPELLVTIALFVLLYAFLIIAWVRLIRGYIKKGPVEGFDGETIIDANDQPVLAEEAE